MTAPPHSRLLVVTTDDLAPGFRLAGAATVACATPEAAREAVLGLLDEGHELGVVAVHEPYLNAFDAPLRRRLDRTLPPLVVALPDGARRDGDDDRRARMLQMLWQAVGYEITFDPEAST